MDKKNKGLADNGEGDIILNESGTSVSFGWDADEKEENNTSAVLPKAEASNNPARADDLNEEA